LISLAAEDEPGIQENNLDLEEIIEVGRLIDDQWLIKVNNQSPTR